MDINVWKERYKALSEVELPEGSKAKLNKALESGQLIGSERSTRSFGGLRFLVGVPAAALLLVGVFLVATLPKQAATLPKQVVMQLPEKSTPDLPILGSYDNLKTLLTEAQAAGTLVSGFTFGGAVQSKKTLSSLDRIPNTYSSNSDVYSSTNVQVQGVDEADVVKTDGQYVYQVNGERVIIAQVAPSESMKIINSIDFTSAKVTPQELYVDREHMVVIGNSFTSSVTPENPTEKKPNGSWSPVQLSPTVKVIIYDISNKANVTKLRELELEGVYVASRKIDSALYLVANKYLDYYGILNGSTEQHPPFYLDTAVNNGIIRADFANIRYFPDFVEPNYLTVAALNLNDSAQPMQVETYLGGGSNVYASADNLYVAVGRAVNSAKKEGQPSAKQKDTLGPAYPQTNTVVYKFALAKGRVKYQAQGELPGRVLNQFSMDEDQGYFRAATTKGQFLGTGELSSTNNVYILDQNLRQTGKIEDIAPGERIYSVRFADDRAYVVTFKQVDPFFVIDLKDVKSPKILGALKIPGYSDYLQPYDSTHIIGFGKDTVTQSKQFGNGTQEMEFYQGMKLALFDVSDVAHPKEMFKQVIGDRGTDSELLRNHKALLFDKDKNLLSFPVTVAEINDKNSTSKGNQLQYGEYTFQGAYVYNLDLSNGFTLRGKVTHLTDQELLTPRRNWLSNDKSIMRIIYIGDTLYTISQAEIKANNLADLKEINTLLIPAQK